ncbi:hypothetical protein CVT26_004827 [Gymnopilus dilepis]|uniref:Uncharacterized protein n=1 Tax=Gymnopilus dilepis TaxID=231916 RepID=A0A409XZJ2_9AGAR|nr:hypothetical protein CVT26_004827 [Gymnopilus dilepis]
MYFASFCILRRQLDLFTWLLRVNDVDHVPSVRTMNSPNAFLEKSCGVDTIEYDGVLGHQCFINRLSQTLAQVNAFLKCYIFPHHTDRPPGNGESSGSPRRPVITRNSPRGYDTQGPCRRQRLIYLGQQCSPTTLSVFPFNGLYGKMSCTERHGFWRYSLKALACSAGSGVRDIQTTAFQKVAEPLGQEHQVYSVPHPSRSADVRTKQAPLTSSVWSPIDPAEGNHWRKLA